MYYPFSKASNTEFTLQTHYITLFFKMQPYPNKKGSTSLVEPFFYDSV